MNTQTCKWLVVCFGVLLCALLVLHLRTRFELNTTKSDIRFARGLVRTFQNYRSVALAGNADQAANALELLREPPGPEPFQNAIADFVERERGRAVADVIAYLRVKTGENYGDDPEKWVEAIKTQAGSKK